MRASAIIFFLVVTLTVPATSQAQGRGPHGMMGQGMYRGGPYGNYCPDMQWGPYGVRKPVRTAKEAKHVIDAYLSGNTEGAHVGKLEEKNLYFEAEILDRTNSIIDKAIVNKRTGRIRSIY